VINIPAREVYLDSVELSQYYDMSQPGVYSIQFPAIKRSQHRDGRSKLSLDLVSSDVLTE